MPQKKVFGLPARRNRRENPYNFLLAEALEKSGWSVVDPSVKQALFGRADIVHVHWPQQYASAKGNAYLYRLPLFVLTLAVQKLRGARVIWTAHNVTSHSSRRPKLEHMLMAYFVRLVDGVIYLSESVKQSAEDVYLPLRRVRSRIVPHGVYGDAYPPSPTFAEARARFGLESSGAIAGVIGDIRPYKGIDRVLANLTRQTPCFEVLIAGALPKDDYGKGILRQINDARQAGWKVHLFDKRLDDAELVAAITACSVIAFPYLTESTSGMAMLAAERGIRIVSPPGGAFDTLQAQLGGRGMTRTSTFDVRDLEEAIAGALSEDPAARVADLRDCNDWRRIAKIVTELYEDAIGHI
ncbi:Glycosyltransferase involved in cell wall bisynthesis [Sphingomonas gellani]|uniref:Glycosyltransferase involved in cell wall bisynthesis n=1 Tax=Sphingomonas gellani TaxID=1166340 RepID=A0A1H8AR40_9SPHN|nr:glycosyltransferase [Sphingomonas gellani]SEM73182.1 Glycosyltransferase involved in cell wall bisynthesis [Sphingomonas gellani]